MPLDSNSIKDQGWGFSEAKRSEESGGKSLSLFTATPLTKTLSAYAPIGPLKTAERIHVYMDAGILAQLLTRF